MGNLFAARVGNILTVLMGNVLTVGVGKVLDIYSYFPNGQLRTLQRRVRTWRHVMAKGLVYAGLDASVSSEVVAQPALDKLQTLW